MFFPIYYFNTLGFTVRYEVNISHMHVFNIHFIFQSFSLSIYIIVNLYNVELLDISANLL